MVSACHFVMGRLGLSLMAIGTRNPGSRLFLSTKLMKLSNIQGWSVLFIFLETPGGLAVPPAWHSLLDFTPSQDCCYLFLYQQAPEPLGNCKEAEQRLKIAQMRCTCQTVLKASVLYFIFF